MSKKKTYNPGDLVFIKDNSPWSVKNKFDLVEWDDGMGNIIIRGIAHDKDTIHLVRRNHNVQMMSELSDVNALIWEALDDN